MTDFPTLGVVTPPEQDLEDVQGTVLASHDGKKISNANPIPVAIIAGGEFAGTVAAVTVADGADATQGTKADTAWTGSGAASVIALLKAIWTKLSDTAGATRTPSLDRVSDNNTYDAGLHSITIKNVGSATGTVLGADLHAGESVTFEADGSNLLGAIAYNATGTTFLISAVL